MLARVYGSSASKFPAFSTSSATAPRAYTGWPDRLYLIDANGRMAYKSMPGPFGFEPDLLRAALVRTVGTAKASK